MKSNLGPRLETARIYIVFTAVMYYTLPFIGLGTSPQIYNAVPILDCCVALGVGYFYGTKAKRDPIMPLVSALLFLPCMFIFFNTSAWIYLLVAPLMSFVGECFGAMYKGKFM